MTKVKSPSKIMRQHCTSPSPPSVPWDAQTGVCSISGAFPGVAETAGRVSIQPCDLKAKPLCVKHCGTPKIDQEHPIHVQMTVKVTETPVTWQTEAGYGRLSF